MNEAQKRIYQYLQPSPFLKFNTTSSPSLYFKLESQLPTNSFKIRPALNGIIAQLDQAKTKGVVTSSSGNFAQAVAYVCQKFGIRAHIIMMNNTSTHKIEKTKKYGANVILCEPTFESRWETTRKIKEETQAVFLHPYDSELTIEADGTIGLEIAQHMTEQKISDYTVVVPVSGGGLLAGISMQIKSIHPSAKIIGVQPLANASMKKSWDAKRIVNVGPVKTVADALIASQPGEKTFSIIQKFVDNIVTVSEESILQAQESGLQNFNIKMEAGAAVGLAAFTNNLLPPKKNTIFVISGAN